MSFKEYLTESTIPYEEWKKMMKALDKEYDDADKALIDYTKGQGYNSSLNVPDEIRTTNEYIKLKNNYNSVFKRLQQFNKATPKEYLRQASKERRLRTW